MSTRQATSKPPPEPNEMEVIPPSPATLSEAISLAQSFIGSVGKDSRNDFHKYDYVSAESMVSAARAALQRASVAVRRVGAIIMPTESSDVRINRKTGEEVRMPVFNLRSIFRVGFGNEHEDTTFDWAVIPDAGRPLDKAAAGAMTTSLSYFLRDLLLVPRQDDDSTQDQRDDSNHSGVQRQPRGADPGRLGVRGAMNIRQQVREAGLNFKDLEAAIRNKTPDAAADPSNWPLAWADTVPIWIEREKAKLAAAQTDATVVASDNDEPPF